MITKVLPIKASEKTNLSYEDIYPDLNCFGEITWDDIVFGTIVKNIYYVENIGGTVLDLYWEITQWLE